MNLWVYVLQSGYDGTHYVGHTKDVIVRLKEHNLGKCRYTKGRRPWKVVYQEEVISRSEAMKREYFWKSGVGRKMLKDLLCSVV